MGFPVDEEINRRDRRPRRSEYNNNAFRFSEKLPSLRRRRNIMRIAHIIQRS